jgi:hypothetical protein
MEMVRQETPSFLSSTVVKGRVITIGILALVLALPVAASVNLWYSETKGPYKNLTEVVDLEGDGDLDIVVGHTRWEAVDISWAGVGRWINQGDGTFELLRDQDSGSFGGLDAAIYLLGD